MKTYREFITEQQQLTELGPIGSTIAGVMGVLGAGTAGIALYKKAKNKITGYRQAKKEKSGNPKGEEVIVKKFNKDTGKIESVIVNLPKAMTNDELKKFVKKYKDQATTDNEIYDIKNKPKPEPEEPTPEKQEPEEPTSKPEPEKQEPKDDGVKLPRDYVGKNIKDIPDDMKNDVQNLERKKLKNTKDVENHMKRWGLDRVVGWTKKRGSSGMPGDYEYVEDSFILNFSNVLYEDLRSDLQKMTNSKTDGELTLSDGSSILIDPITAQILVKYIDSLDSSEKKKTITQLQRTERAFMKVLNKAHEV